MSSKNGLGWPGRSAELVELLTGAGAATSPELPGELRARMFAPVPNGPTQERPITVDQTHMSVVVGERLVVKWMRTPVQHARAVDLLAHLAAVDFAATPTPYAAVFADRSPGGGPALVALVTEYLPDARDGWDWCVEALVEHLRGEAPAGFAAGLGELVAGLHAALATPSAVLAEPVCWSTDPAWHRGGERMLERALDLAGETGSAQDQSWLTGHADALRADLAAALDIRATWVMPLHGDLHVGQVLRWRDGEAVTDFDGNPAAGRAPSREPAARDVAQLRTSLAHVGQVADRRTEGRHRPRVIQWTRQAMDELLAAYRREIAARGVEHIFDERLLRPFEVEQECRELVYASRFLPRWWYAPMGVLRSWYE